MRRLQLLAFVVGIGLLVVGTSQIAAQQQQYVQVANYKCGAWTCQNQQNGSGWPGFLYTTPPTPVSECKLYNNQPQITICLGPSTCQCQTLAQPPAANCDGVTVPPPGGQGQSCFVQWNQCSGTVVPPGGCN